jgi:hypothetical protein
MPFGAAYSKAVDDDLLQQVAVGRADRNRLQDVDALLAAAREDSRAGRALAALTLFTVYARVL